MILRRRSLTEREDAAGDEVSLDFREPDFDLVEPGGVCGRLMIEVLVSSGTDTDRKRALVAALIEKLGEASVEPNNIMVFFLETDRTNGSFGGDQFAPPAALT